MNTFDSLQTPLINVGSLLDEFPFRHYIFLPNYLELSNSILKKIESDFDLSKQKYDIIFNKKIANTNINFFSISNYLSDEYIGCSLYIKSKDSKILIYDSPIDCISILFFYLSKDIKFDIYKKSFLKYQNEIPLSFGEKWNSYYNTIIDQLSKRGLVG